MGTSLQNPNIILSLDGATDTAFLRLDVDIEIPRENYLELAGLMDGGNYDEALALMHLLRPDAETFLNFFFGRALYQRSKVMPAAARIA